jgi:glutamyl-tRNA synthetase
LMRLSPAAFNEEKLNWINGEYIRKLSDQELTKRLVEFLPDHPAPEKISQLVPLIKERIKVLSDFVPLTDFIFEKPDYDKTVFKKILKNREDKDIQELYGRIVEKMEELKKPFQTQDFEKTFKEMAEDENFSNSDFFQLLRLGISGQLITPPLFESIKVLGEEETISRLKNVAQNYSSFVDEVEEDLDITTDSK